MLSKQQRTKGGPGQRRPILHIRCMKTHFKELPVEIDLYLVELFHVLVVEKLISVDSVALVIPQSDQIHRGLQRLGSGEQQTLEIKHCMKNASVGSKPLETLILL